MITTSATLVPEPPSQRVIRTPRAVGRVRLGFLYVMAVPLFAAISVVEGLEIAGLNYTGFLWISSFVVGLAILACELAIRPDTSISFPLRLWAPWIALIWFSLIWTQPLGIKNVQESLQISMPVLVGVLASIYVRSSAQLLSLERIFKLLVWPLCVFAVLTWLGAWESLGYEAHARPLALTTVLVGCVYLSGLGSRLAVPLAGWALCLLISVLTGSRMAGATLLVIPVFHPLVRPRWRFAAIGMSVIVGAALFQLPAVQERFFDSGSGTMEDLFTGNFSGSGRFNTWPLILDEAWRNPVLGHGVGTASNFVPTVWPEASHAHNDYLRVGFELGFVGLVAFIAVLVLTGLGLRRQFGCHKGVEARMFAAAYLGLAAFMLIAMTDNPLIYNLWYMNPWFVLMGGAYGAATGERFTLEVASP